MRRRSRDIVTKAQFLKYRTKCPWYWVDHGEPRCMAQQHGRFYQRHCSVNNCAVIYWMEVLNAIQEKSKSDHHAGHRVSIDTEPRSK